MKTFNYESNCVRYKNCFFDIGEYKDKSIELNIYGYVENDTNISHISNATVNVSEKLNENQVVIDTYSNTNLISYLLDLGIIKGISERIIVNCISYPVVELDLEKLHEYSYEQEALKYAS